MENTIKLNTLIALIQAFLGACKDLHYTCKGYSRHIFADAIADDDLYDTIDSIKENIYIANGLPLPPSKVFCMMTAVMTPVPAETDHANLLNISQLINKVLELVNGLDMGTRQSNVLFDDIADAFAKAKALTIIELKGTPIMEGTEETGFNIEEAYEEAVKILHDHKAATEKEVDRKEVKAIYPDGEKVAKRVLDYEAQNVLVAEDSALDRVSKKLGIE